MAEGGWIAGGEERCSAGGSGTLNCISSFIQQLGKGEAYQQRAQVWFGNSREPWNLW